MTSGALPEKRDFQGEPGSERRRADSNRCGSDFGLGVLPPELRAKILELKAKGRPSWLPTAKPEVSGVYFIEAENGLVKIGYAKDVRARFSTIQSHSPLRLRLAAFVPGPSSLEAEYHARFAASLSHGEWFAKSAELRAFLDEEAAA